MPLVRLIYVSQMTDKMDVDGLKEILSVARQKNELLSRTVSDEDFLEYPLKKKKDE